MDNAPEMIAWRLRDYCRLTGTRAAFIQPGPLCENPFVESFKGPVPASSPTSMRSPRCPCPGRYRSLADRVPHLWVALLPPVPDHDGVRDEVDRTRPPMLS